MKLVDSITIAATRYSKPAPLAVAETASLADEAARRATTVAKVIDVDGQTVEVKVDLNSRVCLPKTA